MYESYNTLRPCISCRHIDDSHNQAIAQMVAGKVDFAAKVRPKGSWVLESQGSPNIMLLYFYITKALCQT